MSKAGIGGIVTAFMLLCSYFGIIFPEGTDDSLIEAVGTIAGLGLLLWGQMARKDLKFGLLRK